jgi:hypothetical protein
VSLSLLSCSKLVLFFFVVLFYFYANFFFLDNLIQASSSRVLEFGIDQNDRARARTIYFPTRAGLAQDFSARVELELELYCYLNEPIPNRQYPLRIGSFTPLSPSLKWPPDQFNDEAEWPHQEEALHSFHF